MSNRPDSHTTSGESGFTIIEVMLAMAILIFGVLGTIVLVQGSLAGTSRTAAREQGTNLARDLVERSRQATYASVTVANAGSVLAATLPAAEVSGLSGSTFQVTRRGVDYTVQVSACAVDDPTDGAGKGTAAQCAVGPGSNTPGPPPALAAGKVRVLGVDIDVAVSGTLLDTVCKAVGTNTEIANTVSAVLSPIAPVAVCPGAGFNPGGAVQIDNDPDDMRRVRVDVSWTRGSAGSVSQTTLLPNPSQN